MRACLMWSARYAGSDHSRGHRRRRVGIHVARCGPARTPASSCAALCYYWQALRCGWPGTRWSSICTTMTICAQVTGTRGSRISYATSSRSSTSCSGSDGCGLRSHGLAASVIGLFVFARHCERTAAAAPYCGSCAASHIGSPPCSPPSLRRCSSVRSSVGRPATAYG